VERRIRPGLDPQVAPDRGRTRDGQPLSYNRAPIAELAPWIARIYVTRVELPSDYTLECGLFCDTANVRIQLSGNWRAQTADGLQHHSKAALFFGPHTQRMPITVSGGFTSLGFSLRPGGARLLGNFRVADFVDLIAPIEGIGLDSAAWLKRLDAKAPAETLASIMEDMLGEYMSANDVAEPDPVTACFEKISFEYPEMSVSEAARRCEVDRRRLERIVLRDFGMSPKQVLRRARALDMASHLRGVADSEEGPQMALRYYDESHLIHDFTKLFGSSPRQFASAPQPLMTLALESRQARRLEALGRIAPGHRRPWQ
jgi:AraC-like DNA-binding protein